MDRKVLKKLNLVLTYLFGLMIIAFIVSLTIMGEYILETKLELLQRAILQALWGMSIIGGYIFANRYRKLIKVRFLPFIITVVLAIALVIGLVFVQWRYILEMPM